MSTGGLASGRRGALVAACLLFLVGPGFAQHAGLRQQWQPQTERDPRLQQRVEMELVCISTQRGLPLLAEKTGVPLSVAPENLDTTGERKFTTIAEGCTLKEIMVQLCEALRECHWDVDTSGGRPAYLLHRNAGVEAAEEERQEAVRGESQARRRRELVARIEEARRALAMTPEEVAELEKTDLFLARALRYPPRRHAMEAFFALAPEQIEQLGKTGQLGVPYLQLPEKAQRLLLQAAQEQVDESIRMMRADPDEQQYLAEAREQAQSLPERIQRVTVYASYSSTLGLGMSLRGEGGGQIVLSVPPRYARAEDGILAHLLVATGDTKEAAAATLRAQYERREQLRKEEEERRRQARRNVAPELRQMMAVDIPEHMPRLALLRLVAEKTGLSVISDAYWSDSMVRDPEPLPKTMPIQQLLDTAATWGGFEWWSVGKCVVFRGMNWYDQEQADVPESVVLRYREKLRAQSRFTLDDAVALATDVSGEQRSVSRGWMVLPEDLVATGVGDLTHPRLIWAPALLVSLTAEQRAQAERVQGLRLAELSQKQRDSAQELTGGRFGEATGQPEAVFRIVQSEGVEEGRHYRQYDLRLQWGESEDEQLTAWARLFVGGTGSEGTTDEHR